MKNLFALVAGLLFGGGLALSGMTDTAKVLGFLHVFHDWDATLVWVIVGATGTTFIGYRRVFTRERPVFAAAFQLPSKKTIDSRLLIGAALFGVGWGLYGYCPGPAIASLAYFRAESLAFVAAMLVGSYCVKLVPAS